MLLSCRHGKRQRPVKRLQIGILPHRIGRPPPVVRTAYQHAQLQLQQFVKGKPPASRFHQCRIGRKMHLFQCRRQGQQSVFQTHLLRHPVERLLSHQFDCLLDCPHQNRHGNAAGQRIGRVDQFLAVVRQHVRCRNFPPQQSALQFAGHAVPAARVQSLKAVGVVV